MSFSNRDFWRPAQRKYRECRLCTCYSLKPFNNKPYLEILTQLSAGYMLFRYRTSRYYTASSREWKFRSVRSTVSTAFLVFSGRTAERDKFIRIVLLLFRVVVESCIYFPIRLYQRFRLRRFNYSSFVHYPKFYKLLSQVLVRYSYVFSCLRD